MAKIKLLNLKGETVKDIELNDNVWNIEVNEPVLFDAVTFAQAGLRQGTAKTKTRAEVSGGGRKPYKQKGTGRARQGSIRSPQWVGGGTVFGPTPRDYSKKMNKKERRLAMLSALSLRYQGKNLIAVDSLKLDSNKTKEFAKNLEAIKAGKSCLVVTNKDNANLLMASSNLKNVTVVTPDKLNVLEIMLNESLVVDEDSIKTIEGVLE